MHALQFLIVDQQQHFANLLATTLVRHYGELAQVELTVAIPKDLTQYQLVFISTNLLTAYNWELFTDCALVLICDHQSDPWLKAHSGIPYILRSCQLPNATSFFDNLLKESKSSSNDRLLLLAGKDRIYIKQKLNSLFSHFHDRGIRVYYFPLISLYQLSLANECFGSLEANNLNEAKSTAELLLSLEHGQVTIQHYFFHHASVWLPNLDCAPLDLCQLSLVVIKNLITSIRAYLAESTDTVFILEAEFYDLDFLAKIASLCDIWFGDLPKDKSYGSVLYQQQLAKHLANLPKSCKFMPIEEI